jgi:DNA-binding GntR family transcriptional regulator
MDVEFLDQRNLPERISDHLVQLIVVGELKLGARIHEIPLSEKLGVSRSSLREALRLLEARGVIVATPQKGSALRMYEAAAIGSIYAVRETIELRAFAELLEEPSRIAAVLAAVQPVIERMETFQGRSNAMLNTLDIAFHSKLVEGARDFVLSAIWRGIRDHLAITFSLEITDGSTFADDHRQLAAALQARDWRQLEAAYRFHISKDRLDVA